MLGAFLGLIEDLLARVEVGLGACVLDGEGAVEAGLGADVVVVDGLGVVDLV